MFVCQAEQELRVAQTEFDRQAEVTRLLLEGISSTHVRDPHASYKAVNKDSGLITLSKQR